MGLLASADGRLILISADCHGGAQLDVYRDYLDPGLLAEFDEWRGAYRNPFRDLQDDGRSRNWDDDRRVGELADDGVVAEVVFPNTVPPFFPTGALIARQPQPEEFRLRLAGIRAHNRWLADWCAGQPGRRAGVGQVFLNDVDEAIADAKAIKSSGLTGGILLPTIPPDAKHIVPLHAPDYDPLWAVCEDLGIPVTNHGGGGLPDYGAYPASSVMWLAEASLFGRRPLTQLIMSGVFERFPRLRFVVTEQGCSWVPPLLKQLDSFHDQMSRGRVGELKYGPDEVLPMKPSEYFARNVWIGCSFPSPAEAAARHLIGASRFLWGSDYPHHESTYPHSRAGLRLAFGHDSSAEELQQVLGANAAHVYGFDLEALAPIAAKVGPTPEEILAPFDGVPVGATSPAFFRD